MAKNDLTWLSASFVEKILRNSEKDESIEVSDIIIKPATAVGDNYSSDMHRVGVEFTRVQNDLSVEEKISLIVKVAPQGDIREQMVEGAGFFVTELSMMSVTLPLMNELLETECSTSIAPYCLYVQYEKPTHAVIEDLAPKGFRMADRRAGLDLSHCLLAIRNLGKFHAASIAVKERNPEAITKYTKGLAHKDQPPHIGQHFNLLTKQLANVTTKWPELNPRIAEKLSKLSEVFHEKICEAARYQEDDFNVLNHGDFWVNNMMFRYDEQQNPIDNIFVDFQISNYASPAIDLLYFFGTSPTDNIRHHHRELLLREYHASLASTMTNLKCNTEVLSFDDLKEILKKRAFYELMATIIVLPIVTLEKGEEIDLGEMVELDVNKVYPGFRGKSYSKIMTRLLPWYDSMGLLDV